MKKKAIIISCILAFAVAGAACAYLLPRYLAHEAIQKPEDTGEFITAPPPEVNLSDKISEAMKQYPPITTEARPQQNSVTDFSSPPPATSPPTHRSVQQIPAKNTPSQIDNKPVGQSHTQLKPQAEIKPQLEMTSATPPPASETHPVPDFQVRISEGEIGGMVYHGMNRNIHPDFRPAFKGVSVKLRDGRGKVTVALAPQYLPEQMLRNLPGVDRSTPVIYMGGEVGLNFDSKTVYPVIHSVSLGNLSIPYAAIKAMIRHEVHRQIDSMVQLKSGQQIELTNVSINSGYLSVSGNVR